MSDRHGESTRLCCAAVLFKAQLKAQQHCLHCHHAFRVFGYRVLGCLVAVLSDQVCLDPVELPLERFAS
jgi:hypothetical protein